jgi:hypothetical protein
MEFKEESDVETLLESFFFDGETFFMDTLKFYIKRLKVLRAWFEEQSSVSFYSSSILFVYDRYASVAFHLYLIYWLIFVFQNSVTRRM